MREIDFDREKANRAKPVNHTEACENGKNPQFCNKKCSAYSKHYDTCAISCKRIPLDTTGFHLIKL